MRGKSEERAGKELRFGDLGTLYTVFHLYLRKDRKRHPAERGEKKGGKE